MTGSIDLLNQYFAQFYQVLQVLVFGPRNYVFFGVVGIAVIGAIVVKRGFKKKTEIVEAAPTVPTAEKYLTKEPVEQDRNEAPPEEPQTQGDPELNRRLDAIEEALMRLSAKSDKTAIEPLLRLSERKIPVEISGTIDGEFDIPISSLRNVRIAVKTVKEERTVTPPVVQETPPTEGD